MIDSGVTVLFVSHDTYAVKNLCERAFYLQAGQLIMEAPAKDVIEVYRNEIVKMRRELVGEDTEKVMALIEEAKLSQMDDDTKDFNIPTDAESLKRGKEIFEKNAAYNRSQDGRAELINVQLMDTDGEIISDVLFGQEVILRMIVKFNVNIECLGMAYHIRNATGIDLIYTDSRFNKTKAIFDAKRGEVYTIDWKFKVELRQELYDIACVVSTPIDDQLMEAHICDYVPCALQFNVISPDVYSTMVGGYVHWHNDLKINRVKI